MRAAPVPNAAPANGATPAAHDARSPAATSAGAGQADSKGSAEDNEAALEEARALLAGLATNDPPLRATPPESDLALYAGPRALPAKRKTADPEPAIVVRRSVMEPALAQRSEALAGSASAGPAPSAVTAPIDLRSTVKVPNLGPAIATKKRVAAVFGGATLVLLLCAALYAATRPASPPRGGPAATTPSAPPIAKNAPLASPSATPPVESAPDVPQRSPLADVQVPKGEEDRSNSPQPKRKALASPAASAHAPESSATSRRAAPRPIPTSEADFY